MFDEFFVFEELRKALLLYHTLKYLKWVQIRYRIYYLIKNKVAGQARRESVIDSFNSTRIPSFKPFIRSKGIYTAPMGFRFLNQTKVFANSVDWNFLGFGKLWLYNLSYFEFVTQSQVKKGDVEKLVSHFHDYYFELKDALEPYPSSLRLMNLIKFTSEHQIENETIESVLSMDVSRLLRNLEYHLLGNHLLENGFALLFAGTYFSNTQLVDRAKSILKAELNEQILQDGAHFELSPMYHQIILYRLLDSINLIRNNPDLWGESFLTYLEKKASKMVGWMTAIHFSNGQMPHVNDCTEGIAPSSNELTNYAQKLAISPQFEGFSESGYRRFNGLDYELLMDVGNIGPDYIPGHAHSDSLNFIVYWNQKPIIVDTGVTTYEKGEVRNSERSTSGHNTVVVSGINQSAVWDAFRVAKRAYSTIEEENEHGIHASHDGYKKIGTTHSRRFTHMQDSLMIFDHLTSKASSKAYFHFHSDIMLHQLDNSFVGQFGKISFKGHSDIRMGRYRLSVGFNNSAEAQVVIVTFNKELETNIDFNRT